MSVPKETMMAMAPSVWECKNCKVLDGAPQGYDTERSCRVGGDKSNLDLDS
jgi:hypothetical protein